MFEKAEISELESFYEDIQDEQIESFLDPDEVQLIKQNFGLAYENLRNYVFVPKRHEENRTTIRLQRLNTSSFDLGDWLKKIAYSINYSPDMVIEVGYSFICRSGKNMSGMNYVFTAKGFASYTKKFSTSDELIEFAEELGKLKETDLLRETFWIANAHKRFQRSGWVPYALVCNYIWLTK